MHTEEAHHQRYRSFCRWESITDRKWRLKTELQDSVRGRQKVTSERPTMTTCWSRLQVLIGANELIELLHSPASRTVTPAAFISR